MKQKDYVNGRLWTILDIWSFKRKIFTDERLLKHKARLCAHGRIQKMGYKLLGDLRSSSKLDQCPNPAYNNQNSQAEVADH